MSFKIDFKFVAITGIFLLLVVFVVLYFTNKNLFTKIPILNSQNSGANDYNAVFLSNGQIFFGQLVETNSKYIILKSIYYVRQSSQVNETNQDNKIDLIKRGQELHGPQDQMMITREHILFIEKIGFESKLGKAIKQAQQMDTLGSPVQAKSSSSNPSPVPKPSTKAIKLITVQDNEVGFLRVRKEANSNSEEIGKVTPGTNWTVLQEKEGWYQIEYEVGKIGWVSKKFTSEVK